MESLDETEICSPEPCQTTMCQSSANSSQQVYTPQVKNDLIPKIGQHFDNLDEVHTFYNNYARKSGFGTRINSSKKSRDNQIIRKEYCCYKEGVKKSKANNSEPSTRRRGLTREGCGAKLTVVKDKAGPAFLHDELTTSFEWLFQQWLKAMPAGPPKMIITDQDPAMTKAIASTLPSTHHRYCLWHIVNKFSEKIGAISYKEHYDEFKSCIWKFETPREFDERWVQVVEKAKLTSNEWLNGMYNIRERWVPAYMNHMFSAHMTSSQRAEISHAFFRRYLSPHNSLWDFVTRFERALATIRHNELDLDHKDINEKPILKTMWGMEETMSQIYTRKMFYMFQDELFQLGAYEVTLTFEDEHQRLYNVKRDVEDAPKGREVSVDKSSHYVTCSCKMFETGGIPCRHILAYFNYVHIRKLPNTYILRRWTKSAKAGRVRHNVGEGSKEICDTSVLMRRGKLFLRSSNVIDDAVLTEEGTEIYNEALDFAEKKLAALKINRGEEAEQSAIEVVVPLESEDCSLKEPTVARTKGSGKRLKGGKEKSVNKKKRRCNGCGEVGASHDKRNCPKLLAMSSQTVSQSVRLNDEDEDEDESMDYNYD